MAETVVKFFVASRSVILYSIALNSFSLRPVNVCSTLGLVTARSVALRSVAACFVNSVLSLYIWSDFVLSLYVLSFLDFVHHDLGP